MPRCSAAEAAPLPDTSHEDALFTRVVDIIEAARGHVTRSVNTAMVQGYWLVGCEIVEVEQRGEKRAGYGARVIEGLAKSNGEHPGHLLFPLFAQLLGGSSKPARRDLDPVFHRGADLDELEARTADPEEPRIATLEVDALVALAGFASISDATSRRAVLAAMKKAAETRVAGVTDQKRRRHYGHAAELVASCVGCDKTGQTTRWAAALKAELKRFPALRDELERALRAP